MIKPLFIRVISLVSAILLGWSFNDPEPLISGDFNSPLNESVRLSGSFGELRPNHFHEGIDIKGALGTPIFAAADGYISRIGISGSGYGKALYLSHPNGFTSLYAHMKTFTPAVNDYVREIQFDEQRFELDLSPEKDLFPVRKGDLIGYIGLTGSTQGPHLHFEIRETDSGNAVNPLLMGVPFEDEIPPLMRQLKVYHLGPGLETLQDETLTLVSRNGTYTTLQDTLVIGAWRAGFGLKAFDRMNGSYNLNGLYSLEMYEDGVRVYSFKMDRLQKQESKYINAHLDYEEQVRRRSYFNRCFILPGNDLEIYRHENKPAGVVQLSQYKAKHIRLVAGDLNGNTSELAFWVKRGSVVEREPVSYNYILPHDEESVVQGPDASIGFASGTFYADLFLQYDSFADSSAGHYSLVHSLQPSLTPLHEYFELSIRAEGLPEELREKAFIGRCDLNNVVVNYGGRWKGDFLSAKVKTFGDFVIMTDLTPPEIRPINFSSRHVPGQTLKFKIRDDIAGGGLKYEGSIDGNWILMEYDAKNNLLTHVLEKELGRGRHELRLLVTDAMGNQAEFKQEFAY